VAPHLFATAQFATPCDLEPLGCGLVSLQFRHFFVLFGVCGRDILPISPPATLALSLFCLPDALSLRDPALFAFGDKPSLFAHGAQDTTSGHLFAEALEQALL
jgi:hypothetical protein